MVSALLPSCSNAHVSPRAAHDSTWAETLECICSLFKIELLLSRPKNNSNSNFKELKREIKVESDI